MTRTEILTKQAELQQKINTLTADIAGFNAFIVKNSGGALDSIAKQFAQQRDALAIQLKNAEQQMEDLSKLLQASAEAEKTLAGQGKSLSALEIEAQGVADSNRAVGAAEASKISQTTEGKQKLYLIGGITVAVITIVVVVLVVKSKIKK